MLYSMIILMSALLHQNVGIAGDTCDSAISISAGLTPFNTNPHTDSGYSPESDCELMGIMYKDIWFSYQALDDQLITISTCDTLSFDTSIIVYEVVNGCDDLEYVTCSGDALSDSSCQPYHSVVQFNPTVNATYMVRVGGWDTDSYGTGTLSVEVGEQDGLNSCPTDLNDDKNTNVSDLLQVIGNW